MTLEELQRYCAPAGHHREYLCAPFREPDGRVVATDANILIVLDAFVGVLAPAEPVMLGQVDRLFESAAALPSLEWLRASDVDLSGAAPCADCRRLPAGRAACPSCEGEGQFEYRGHDYDCKACYAAGNIPGPCPTCRGTRLDRHPIPLGGTFFAPHYLALLATIPDCGLRPAADPTRAALISFPGGRGLLMPCSAPGDTYITKG